MEKKKKECGFTYHMALHSLGLICEELQYLSSSILSLHEIDQSACGSLSLHRVVGQPPTEMDSSPHVHHTRQDLGPN